MDGRTGVGEAGRRAQGAVLSAIRRVHPLPVEMAVVGLTILVWQLVRVPFEVGVDEAVAAARDLMSLERALGVAVEPDVVRWLAGHGSLLDAAQWFYSHLAFAPAVAILAALRLVDPGRFPAVRTAFVLTHLPALLVVAAYPSAPPRWVSGFPYGSPPTVDIGGDLRNSTAAAVSLHVGIPILLAAAAIWIRPRSPVAWLTVLLPVVVLAVVVGTGNHLLADAVVGAGCAAAGIAGAALVHGRPARRPPEGDAATIAVVAVAWGAIAFAIDWGIWMVS